MRRITDRLFIGDLGDCREHPEGMSVVHACKHPCHAGKCGAKIVPAHPDYLAHRDGSDLYLNLIDPPHPLFQIGSFERFLDFAKEQHEQGRDVLIHCNKGESRAPSLALLFCAKVLGIIDSTSYDNAWDGFEALTGQPYTPGKGIETWLRAHWEKLPNRWIPFIEGAATEAQQIERPLTPEEERLKEVQELTPEECEALVMTDPLLYFSGFVRIRDKSDNLTPEDGYNEPHIAQMKAIEAYLWLTANDLPVRLILGPKARQVGFSTISAAMMIHHSLRNRVGGMLIADQFKRTELLWKMFNEMVENDRIRELWGVRHEWNADRAVFTYQDDQGNERSFEWLHDTAKDPKAGASGTRSCLWFSEAGRYGKEGKVTDLQVISNASSSVPDVPGTMIVLESTAEGACYDDQTEILTDQGWKYFKDLSGCEAILTKDQHIGVAYYQPEWEKVAHHWNGDMVRIKTRTVNLLVTSNHMMWCRRQQGPMKFIQAGDMIGPVTDYYFDRGMKWEALGAPDFILPSYTHIQGAGMRTIPEKKIPIAVWLRFLGYWLSDGHASFLNGNKSAVLTQVKFITEFREAINDVAAAIGAKVKEYKHQNGVRFIVSSAQLARYLIDYQKPKRIPRDLLMSMNQEQCRLLLDSIYLGDGDQERLKRPTAKMRYGKIYVGIDRQLQDDVQELALKAGYATSAYGPERNRIATFTESVTAMVRYSNPPTLERGYDGMVYCVSLPKDHLLMVRRGGTAVWCGNSGVFHSRVQGAVTLEERMAGKVGNGWIKVFCAWHDVPDYKLPRIPQYEEYFHGSLDDEEKRGVQLYHWTPEQIAWRRAKLKGQFEGNLNLFKQEFPASEDEAFQSSGTPRFNLEGLARLELLAKTGHDYAELGVLEEQRNGKITFLKAEEVPWFWMKEGPMYGARYLVSGDYMTGEQSAGSEERDEHAICVWRAPYKDENGTVHNMKLVAVCWTPKIACQWDEDKAAERTHLASKLYGNCIIVPEINEAMGVLNELKTRGANIWKRTKEDEASGIVGQKIQIPGWKTTTSTKPIAIKDLAKLIREKEIDVHFKPMVHQMRVFVQNSDGSCSAKPGEHDDWVMSAAIASATIESATLYSPPEAVTPTDQYQSAVSGVQKGGGALG